MIKLGLQSLSYKDAFAAGRMDVDRFLDHAAELRLDGVDLHVRHLDRTDDESLERLRLRSLRLGLPIGYLGVSNDFGRQGEELEAQIRRVQEWVDVAVRLRVPMVRVFGAWVRGGATEEEVWPRLVAASRRVTAYARERRVLLGLQNHNHGCIPATGAQTLRLLDAVDDPYFTHILDTGQYRGSPGASGAGGIADPEHDLYESIRASAPRAVHVRAKIYRIASGREEWLDYPRILAILRDVGFNGWMSIVYEGQEAEPEEAAVPRAVRYLRALLREFDL